MLQIVNQNQNSYQANHFAISVFNKMNYVIPSFTKTGRNFIDILKIVTNTNKLKITDEKLNLKYYMPVAVNSRAASEIKIDNIKSSWLPFDLDDIPNSELMELAEKLVKMNIAYIMYTTFSHGTSSEYSRIRLLLFLDKQVDYNSWRKIWMYVNKNILNEFCDTNTISPIRISGVWGTTQDRASAAYTAYNHGLLLHADRILAISNFESNSNKNVNSDVRIPNFRTKVKRVNFEKTPKQRVIEALEFLDANNYETWISVCFKLKAGVIAKYIDDKDGHDIWIWFSNRGTNTEKNHLDCYNPEKIWLRPIQVFHTNPEILFKSLLSDARDNALKKAKQNDISAISYLKKYHKSLLNSISGLNQS